VPVWPNGRPDVRPIGYSRDQRRGGENQSNKWSAVTPSPTKPPLGNRSLELRTHATVLLLRVNRNGSGRVRKSAAPGYQQACCQAQPVSAALPRSGVASCGAPSRCPCPAGTPSRCTRLDAARWCRFAHARGKRRPLCVGPRRRGQGKHSPRRFAQTGAEAHGQSQAAPHGHPQTSAVADGVFTTASGKTVTATRSFTLGR
jgi:hypothetical protein